MPLDITVRQGGDVGVEEPGGLAVDGCSANAQGRLRHSYEALVKEWPAINRLAVQPELATRVTFRDNKMVPLLMLETHP